MTSIFKDNDYPRPEWNQEGKLKERLDAELKSLATNTNLKHLRSIVQNKYMKLLLEEEKANYNSASWQNRQAHINGNREMLMWFDQLLAFVKQD